MIGFLIFLVLFNIVFYWLERHSPKLGRVLLIGYGSIQVLLGLLILPFGVILIGLGAWNIFAAIHNYRKLASQRQALQQRKAQWWASLSPAQRQQAWTDYYTRGNS
jgi:hypothetical protein